jgi:rSAM/selenodomain-associated transferase 1
MRANPVVVIMAKQPAIGETKTRLSPPLTLSEAATLYEALLQDTIALVAGLAGVQPAIAITPHDAVDYFSSISPTPTILLPVSGSDIGDCLNQVMIHFLALGHPGVIALNSDGPTLPQGYLQQAVDFLERSDVVLGPSEDGGYYLIGLKQSVPELFQDILWSTEHVTTQTLANAKRLGLRVAMLPTWYDLDAIEDVYRLRDELQVLPADRLRHTRRFFRAWSSP